MCFDKKLCSTRELYDAYMANWKGYEVLRQQILSSVPHYGNSDPYADEQMKWVVDTYYDICKECYSKQRGIFKGGSTASRTPGLYHMGYSGRTFGGHAHR